MQRILYYVTKLEGPDWTVRRILDGVYIEWKLVWQLKKVRMHGRWSSSWQYFPTIVVMIIVV
jgi:hypothetical protein